MDSNYPQMHRTEKQLDQCSRPGDRSFSATISPPSRQSSLSTSGRESQDSALGAMSSDHPSLSAPDGPDRYQQGNASLPSDYGGLNTRQKSHQPESIRSKDSNKCDHGPESTCRKKPPDDNITSDFSSRCTSDDFELQIISTDDEMTDDEEIGLTAQDKRHRTRRRRKNTQLDQRVIGIDKASNEEKSKADKNVLQALLINALLIASWYIFSLSISIVGYIYIGS